MIWFLIELVAFEKYSSYYHHRRYLLRIFKCPVSKTKTDIA